MIGLMSRAKLPMLLHMTVTGFAGAAREAISQPKTLLNPLLMSHLLLSNYPKQVTWPNLELTSEETVQGHGYRKAQASWYHSFMATVCCVQTTMFLLILNILTVLLIIQMRNFHISPSPKHSMNFPSSSFNS